MVRECTYSWSLSSLVDLSKRKRQRFFFIPKFCVVEYFPTTLRAARGIRSPSTAGRAFQVNTPIVLRCRTRAICTTRLVSTPHSRSRHREGPLPDSVLHSTSNFSASSNGQVHGVPYSRKALRSIIISRLQLTTRSAAEALEASGVRPPCVDHENERIWRGNYALDCAHESTPNVWRRGRIQSISVVVSGVSQTKRSS